MRTEKVERWGCFELSLPGKQDGNPFTDYTIHGQFRGDRETVSADGFYDGEGIYRIRFRAYIIMRLTEPSERPGQERLKSPGRRKATTVRSGLRTRIIFPMRTELLSIRWGPHAMCGNCRRTS